MDVQKPSDEILFSTALALPVEERGVYLQRACSDASMTLRIQALLDSAMQGEALFQRALSTNAVELGDEQVDNYRLLHEIGEGGWGTVFLAEQTLPLRREVALKIIKLGMDTRALILRFAAERQVLAMMNHPNIAKVLEAGATRAGRPFFAMELVRGIKITDYCNLTRSSVSERIWLFLQVCQAIHHAHRKGVIHRDIKPSNVMVTLVDATPVAKVIDFGIAKAIQGRLTDGTLFTAFDHFMGTPAYVSPEQAERGDVEASPRSDIYSLGVLLYELLCGCTPFAGNDLVSSRMSLLRARMRSEEVLPPSRKLRDLSAEAIAHVAESCGTSRSRLVSEVQGDLDWVIMHCLERDPRKRYGSALELSLDLQHYLRDEPVVARPRRAVYILQKFAKRHRAIVVTSAAVIAVLLSTTLLTTWMAVRATRANQLAQSVANFLQADLLVQDEYNQRADTTTTFLTVLDRAANRVGKRFAGEPLVEASIRSILGRAYASVYADGRSEEQFDQALKIYEDQYGLNDRRTLEAMRELVVSKLQQDRYAAAEWLGVRAMAHAERALGSEDPQYLALATTVALVELERGNLTEKHARELVDTQERVLGLENPITLQGRWILAALAMQRGELTKAESLARAVLEARRQRFGTRHSETYKALGLLQLIYTQAHKCGPTEESPAYPLGAGALDWIVVEAPRISKLPFEQQALLGNSACGVDNLSSLGNVQRAFSHGRAKK